MAKIVFDRPTRESPGYLNRQRMVLRLRRLAKAGELTDLDLEEMIEVLLQYVSEPSDPEQARALVWQLSEQEFDELLAAASGGGDDSEDPTGPASSST